MESNTQYLQKKVFVGKNPYILNVESGSTRTEIKHWVELFVGVKVIPMNSHRLPGKGRRMGPIMGHTMHYRRLISFNKRKPFLLDDHDPSKKSKFSINGGTIAPFLFTKTKWMIDSFPTRKVIWPKKKFQFNELSCLYIKMLFEKGAQSDLSGKEDVGSREPR